MHLNLGQVHETLNQVAYVVFLPTNIKILL